MSEAWARGSDTRWRRFRVTILARDKGVCVLREAGCTTRAEQVHHIHPLSRGGAKYDPANCASACASYNLAIGNRAPVAQPAPRPMSSW